MSEYSDFIIDFPSRCQRILDVHWACASRNDVEVTLLLAVAGALLAGTRDRMELDKLVNPKSQKKPPVLRNPLPPEGEEELKQPISKAVPDAADVRWRKFSPDGSPISEQPENWPHFGDECPEEPTMLEALSTIRHALAHGQVQTRGRSGAIKALALLNINPNGKEGAWIDIKPLQLKALMKWWTDFILRHYKDDPRKAISALAPLSEAA